MEELFKDIREGDYVLYPKTVYGKTFFVKAEVTKTTKTQFTLNDKIRVSKKDGRVIGGRMEYAKPIGYTVKGFLGTKTEYADQSKELSEWVQQVKKFRTLTDKAEKLRTLVFRMDVEDLSKSDMDACLNGIKDLIHLLDKKQ